MKKPKEFIPELVCCKKPHKGCNDGFYKVRIPIMFEPKNKHCIGVWQEYTFIGLK